MNTTATKVEGGWKLDGQKRWIGNSTFADILIVFARNTITNQINGFIVRKGAPELRVAKMENKIGLKCVQNGDIILIGVLLLTGIDCEISIFFQDTNRVDRIARRNYMNS